MTPGYHLRVTRRRRRLQLVGVLCASALGACTLFNPLGDYGPGTPQIDGGPQAPPTGIDGGGCALARPPAKPEDGVGGSLDLLFAVNQLALTPMDGGTKRGYDLDSVCTTSAETSSCVVTGDGKLQPDPNGGIDNAGSSLLQLITSATGRPDLIESEDRGVLIRVLGYNGAADDNDVFVFIYLSPGIELGGDGEPITPKHDGTDPWRVDRAGITDDPKNFFSRLSTRGYVAGGELVASLDFPITFGAVLVQLKGAFITAKMVQEGALWSLRDGALAGRWSTREMLTSFDTIPDTATGGGFCGANTTYIQVRRQICEIRDLAASPADDGKGAPCGAVGISSFFTAEPVKFGSIVDVPPLTHYCGADYSDDCPP